MTASPRLYTGNEDQSDAWEGRETRARLGAHHDEGTGAPRPVSLTNTKTASQIVVGDRIVIGKVTYTVDKVTTDNGLVAGPSGYVNLALIPRAGKITHQRHPWYQVIHMAAPAVCQSCQGSGRTLTTRESSTGSEIADYSPCPDCAGRVPVRYEQPPFRSHLAAANWAEDHDEDLNRYDSEDD